MKTSLETARKMAALIGDRNRARVSKKTVEVLSDRPRLTAEFIVALKADMLDQDWVIAEIKSGGFGAVRLSTLEAAKAVTLGNEEERY